MFKDAWKYTNIFAIIFAGFSIFRLGIDLWTLPVSTHFERIVAFYNAYRGRSAGRI